jgi:hypothetical protein
MHVSTTRRHYVGKDGDERTYETHLLRRSVRQGSKVRNETLANLSHLPDEIIEAIKAGLSGETLVVAGSGFDLTRSLPHGHLAAVSVMAKTLGLAELLGPSCKERDIAYALILARVVHPRPKLATTKWWGDTTLVADLGLEGIGTDEVYAAMDWLGERQGPSRPSSPSAISAQRPTPLVSPTSICPLRGWRGPRTSWRPGATRVTSGAAWPRSSTGS